MKLKLMSLMMIMGMTFNAQSAEVIASYRFAINKTNHVAGTPSLGQSFPSFPMKSQRVVAKLLRNRVLRLRVQKLTDSGEGIPVGRARVIRKR